MVPVDTDIGVAPAVRITHTAVRKALVVVTTTVVIVVPADVPSLAPDHPAVVALVLVVSVIVPLLVVALVVSAISAMSIGVLVAAVATVPPHSVLGVPRLRIAIDHSAIRRNVGPCGHAVDGCRLLTRRNSVDPDSAHAGRRTLSGRHSTGIASSSLCAGGRYPDQRPSDGHHLS
ncbi:MAG: hypothetical protein NVS4B3_00330 [Gemmatimonadaceae bacterium]